MDHAILVAQDGVEVELRVVPVTALGAETGPEDVVVVNADVLGGKVERHVVRRCVCWLEEAGEVFV